MIEITAYFGGRYCRVLSGQRRPELPPEEGIRQVVEVITGLLPFAQTHGVVLTMENHYKDNYWQYPEFAQKMDVFRCHCRPDRFAVVRSKLRPFERYPGR